MKSVELQSRIAAAEMTVVRLKGKAPHPIDEAFRADLEKYRLKGI